MGGFGISSFLRARKISIMSHELGALGEFPLHAASIATCTEPALDDAAICGFGTAEESNQRVPY
jgi:hypothetical protein